MKALAHIFEGVIRGIVIVISYVNTTEPKNYMGYIEYRILPHNYVDRDTHTSPPSDAQHPQRRSRAASEQRPPPIARSRSDGRGLPPQCKYRRRAPSAAALGRPARIAVHRLHIPRDARAAQPHALLRLLQHAPADGRARAYLAGRPSHGTGAARTAETGGLAVAEMGAEGATGRCR